jgi:PAS domain S-box-containing protein
MNVRKNESFTQNNLINENNILFIYINLPVIALLIICCPFVFMSNWSGSNDIHFCVEILSAFFALIGGLSCIIYSLTGIQQYYIIIGLGLIILSGEKLANGLFFFNRLFTGIDLMKFIPVTDLAGNLILGILMTSGLIFRNIFGKVNNKTRMMLFFSIASFAIGLAISISGYFMILPQVFFPMLLIPRPFDLAVSMIFLASLIIAIRLYFSDNNFFSVLLVTFTLLNFIAQLCVSLSKNLFDGPFDFSHIISIVSYIMPVIGISFQSLKEIKEKRMEIARRESVENNLNQEKIKFKTITENIEIGINILSKYHDILWSNKHSKKIFGNIENRKCHEIFVNNEDVCGKCNLEECFKSGKSEMTYVFKGIDIMDNVIWMQIITSPIRNEIGMFSTFMQVIIPITERKLIELKLKESEDMLSNFINSAKDGFALLDENLCIKEANKSILQMFGINNKKKILGMNLHQLFHDKTIADICNKCREVIKTGTGYEIEDLTYKTDHGETSVSLNIFKSGNGIGMIVRNITEQKRIREELIRSKEIAEAANKAKDFFLANTSHELRNYLNAIIGIPRMMLKDKFHNLNKAQIETIKVIEETGNKLLILINNLLDLSKIEAGVMNINLDSFSIDDLLSNVTMIVTSLIGQKEINFIIEKENKFDELIISDIMKINQILVNIISNAVKFTENGEIILRIRIENDNLHFMIEDTGIGIDPKDLDSIFGAFKQVGSYLSGKYQGTGLGLNISKKLIDLLNGYIRVESQINKGSKFFFSIPIKTDKNKIGKNIIEEIYKNERIKPEKEKGNVPKILVIDDEKIGRITLKMILEDKFNLSFANTGTEAIDILKNERPDVILMDIIMPEMDGFKTFQKIKNADAGKDIPIIAVTARAMKDEKEIILSYGFNGYVSKPVDEEDLLNSILMQLKK